MDKTSKHHDDLQKSKVDIMNIIKSLGISVKEAQDLLDEVKENLVKYSGAFMGATIEYKE